MTKNDLNLTIKANAEPLKKELKKARAEVDDFKKSVHKTGDSAEFTKTRIDRLKETIGPKLKLAAITGGTALVASAGMAIKASVDFESAFAGVKKTVDGTPAQLNKIRAEIRQMSREIPSSANEISKVAEAAGQLGIQTDSITKFSRVIIDLNNSTNLVGEEGATQLARFANITRMSQKDFDRLGSTIVALGNNSATTESEIVAMGMRIAAAGKQVGLSEAKIMGFAAALSSVGIEAEAGGTAFSKLMVQMQLAIETGEGLKDFAKVAGMSSEKFKKHFKEDAAGALIAFIKGLSESEKKGQSAIKVLDEMGINEVRLRDAVLRAASASELFNGTIAIGNKAWEENTALSKEAAQRYETVASKWQIFKNNLTDLGISFGDKVLPVLNGFFDFFKPKIFDEATNSIGNLSGEVNDKLYPSLASLWKTLKDELIPSLQTFWKQYINPLTPILKETFYGAIKLVADILHMGAEALNFFIDELNKGNPIIWAVTGAFIGLKAAMILGAAFDALKVGFATIQLVSIPGAMASFATFKAAILAPMVMPAIGIGAVMAALGTIIAKANDAKRAIEGANASISNYNSEQQRIQNVASQRYRNGEITKKQYDELMRIGSHRSEGFKMPSFGEAFASGWRSIFGGRASGGPVSANTPYLVGENPDGSINRTTELFVPSSSGYVVNAKTLQGALGSGSSNVYNQTINLTLAVEPRKDFGYDDAVNMIKQINGVLKSQGLNLNQIGAVR